MELQHSYRMTTPKRVSFGSTHGSMVETLIIDDQLPTDEKKFYQHTLLENNHSDYNANQESHDNPFTQEGELSKKAEYILKHSTISRSEIRISDPDLSKGDGEIVCEEISKTDAALNASAPNEISSKNGKLGQALSPQNVEVEVGKANASQPEPQQAEQVKLKEPKCKCCVIM